MSISDRTAAVVTTGVYAIMERVPLKERATIMKAVGCALIVQAQAQRAHDEGLEIAEPVSSAFIRRINELTQENLDQLNKKGRYAR